MKNFILAFFVIFFLLLSLNSCTSDNDAEYPRGEVTIGINKKLEFTRAVDFTAIGNVNNYIINIYNEEDACVFSKTFGEIAGTPIMLEEGSYKLRAHYGELKTASQNDLQLRGTTSFSIESGKAKAVVVECTPASARVNVNFGDRMENYFSDYYVTFTTKALNEEGNVAVWTKTNADPWYLLVDENEAIKAVIHVTRISDGKSMDIERTTTLSAANAWTLDIDAEEEVDEDGTSTFSITIDESTNDKEETITVL